MKITHINKWKIKWHCHWFGQLDSVNVLFFNSKNRLFNPNAKFISQITKSHKKLQFSCEHIISQLMFFVFLFPWLLLIFSLKWPGLVYFFVRCSIWNVTLLSRKQKRFEWDKESWSCEATQFQHCRRMCNYLNIALENGLLTQCITGRSSVHTPMCFSDTTSPILGNGSRIRDPSKSIRLSWATGTEYAQKITLKTRKQATTKSHVTQIQSM